MNKNKFNLFLLLIVLCTIPAVQGALSDGTIVYWDYENNNTNLVSGANNNFILSSGSATYSNTFKITNRSINLSATQTVMNETLTNFPSGNNNFSMCTWFMPQQTLTAAQNHRLMTYGGGPGAGTLSETILIHRYETAGDRIIAGVGNAGVDVAYSMSNGQWYSVCTTYNATSNISTLYINGVSQGTAFASGGVNMKQNTPLFGLNGRYDGSGRLQSVFDGSTAWNRTLTSTEVLSYNSSTAPYPFIETNLATITAISVQNQNMANNSLIWVNFGKVNVSINATTIGNATFTLNASTMFVAPVGQILNTTSGSSLKFLGYFGLNLGTGNFNESASNVGEIGSEGLRHINITARAGTNVTSLYNFSIGFDYTKPNITLIPPFTTNSFNFNTTNYFSYSDALSGVGACNVVFVHNVTAVSQNITCANNVTLTQAGYYNMTIYVTDIAGNQQQVSQYFLVDAINNFRFREATNSTFLSNQDINVTYPNNYSQVYRTNSSGMINVSNVVNGAVVDGTYTFEYPSYDGYIVPTLFTYVLNSSTIPANVVFNVSRFFTNITLYKQSDGTRLLQTGTVVVESTNKQYSYSLNSTGQGQAWTDDYSNNVIFRITALGYAESVFNYDYTSGAIGFINVYMINTSQSVENRSLTITDTFGTPLENVDIVVETFINGTYQQLTQVSTGITGIATFLVIPGNTYRLTSSKTGYTTKIFTDFLTADLTFSLLSDSAPSFSSPFDDVTYTILPTQYYLENRTYNFTFSIQDGDGNLSSFKLYLYNGTQDTGTQIAFMSASGVGYEYGGSLIYSLNVANYTTSVITLVAKFTKNGFTEQSIVTAYVVRSSNSVDIEDIKDNVTTGLSDNWKFMGFVALLLFLGYVLSYIIRGTTLLLILAFVGAILGWFMGLMLIGIGLIILIIIFLIIGLKGGQS